ncbi:MAG: type II CAAX endopeptidase family protein [Myxococcaceae bacterium]
MNAHDDRVNGDEVANESLYRPVPALRLGIASTAVILLLFVTAGATSQFLNPGFGVWFTEVFIFLGVPFVLTRFSLRDPVRWPGMAFPGWAPAAIGLAFGLVNFFGVVAPIQFAMQALFPRDLTEFFDSSRIFENQSTADLALIISGVIIAAPWCEEYFFRGVLQQSIQSAQTVNERRGATVAMLVTAFLFSLFHFDPVGFLARFELGLLFGWLFWRTGSIWPGALAHAANNGISTVIFFASGPETAQQAEQAVTREDVMQILVFAAMGALLLAGLLLLVHARPHLLSRRAHPEVVLPPSSFWKLAAPWLVAGTLSIGLLIAVDLRGIQLRLVDTEYPLPRDLAGELEASRQELLQLRRRARAGEVPIDTYESERRELSRLTGDGARAPLPETMPPTPSPPIE